VQFALPEGLPVDIPQVVIGHAKGGALMRALT
jgi:hypothetical protein